MSFKIVLAVKDKNYNNYKNIIERNLKKNNFIKNLTFPITMFDDTSIDILNCRYIYNLFKFKIINKDKENIDCANTFNGETFNRQIGSRQTMFIYDNINHKFYPYFFNVKNTKICKFNINNYIYEFVEEKIKYIYCQFNNIKFKII